MDVFNPKNILLCLLSKQTGAHSSVHGMQCNWANHLCKDLSSSEQCEFKWYELKPSILDEGLSSEGLWMVPKTCWSLWELWELFTMSEMTASVRISFLVWNTYEFLSTGELLFYWNTMLPPAHVWKTLSAQVFAEASQDGEILKQKSARSQSKDDWKLNKDICEVSGRIDFLCGCPLQMIKLIIFIPGLPRYSVLNFHGENTVYSNCAFPSCSLSCEGRENKGTVIE